MIWALLFLLTPSAAAQDELAELGLSTVSVEHYRLGVEALDKEAFLEAKGHFWRVLITNKNHPYSLLGLGRSYLGAGELQLSGETFDKCRHLSEECALESAQLLLKMKRYRPAVDRFERLQMEQEPEVDSAVRIGLFEAYVGLGASRSALDLGAQFFSLENLSPRDPLNEQQQSAVLQLHDLLAKDWETDEPWQDEVATRWESYLVLLRALSQQEMDVAFLESIRSRIEQVEVEQDARRRFGGIDQPLNEERMAQARIIEVTIDNSRWDEAEVLLEELIVNAPGSSMGWGLSGKLALARTDRPDLVKAEQLFRRAFKLAPNHPEWGFALARILVDGYGGRRDEEAIPVLRDLVGQNRSANAHLMLGDVLHRKRDFAGALKIYQQYQKRWPQGPRQAEVSLRVQGLSRTVPDGRVVDLPETDSVKGIDGLAQWHYHLSVVYISRQKRTEGVLNARKAVELQSDWPVALNHLSVLLSDSKPREALEWVDASLKLMPKQPAVQYRQIELLLSLGQEDLARNKLKALAKDAPEHYFTLAKFYEDSGKRTLAVVALERYFGEYKGLSYRSEAEALFEMIAPHSDRRIWLPILCGVLGILLVSVFWIRRRKRTHGISLREFLESDPRSYHDLARILSGMRHEVLKHNTTLLPSVVEALEKGDHGPALDASGILMGGQGAPGVIELWERYVRELEAVGQANGVRLNLRYMDPQIAPMCLAFRELAELAPQIHKAKADMLVPRLRAISLAVNEVGYRELGVLLHEVCVMDVDDALLDAVWRRVAREPGMVGQDLSAPVLRVAGRMRVRAFREDLEDILANLLRNGCEAVLKECAKEDRKVGIRVVEEMDEITGLSWVAIRVMDNAPSRFDESMLRDRDIGRGVGLARDLAKRNHGSLRVEPEPGFTKAIVLRLGLAEEVGS